MTLDDAEPRSTAAAPHPVPTGGSVGPAGDGSTAATGGDASVTAAARDGSTAATGGDASVTAAAGGRPLSPVAGDDAGDDEASDMCAMAARELSTITEALQRLRSIPWSRVPAPKVLDAAADVEAALRSGFGVQMRLAGEVDRRGIDGAHGARSAAALLAGRLRITVGEAKGRVAAAKVGLPRTSLTGARVDAPLPQLATAVDEGSISDHHARVITDGIAKIPDEVDPDTREMCGRLLMREAQQRDPISLRKVAEQIRLICDEDGTCPKPDPVDVSEFHFGALRADGLTSVRGLLDPLTTEQLRVAIEDLARPRPLDADTPDPRPAPTRRAHALSEVVRRYLALGTTPSDEPHSSTTPSVDGGQRGSGGRQSADRGSLLHSRARPQIGITVRACDLDPHGRETCASHDDPTRIRAGVFDYGGPVSLATARMLACDGDLIPQLLGTDGAVLDQGRAVRAFTRAQRRALITRDKGCAFPACDIPAQWCEAHHITYWSRGGPTDLANGVLLCRRHHVVVHQEQWRIEPAHPNSRARPWFIPPKHLDPERKPRRNSYFHLPECLTEVRRT